MTPVPDQEIGPVREGGAPPEELGDLDGARSEEAPALVLAGRRSRAGPVGAPWRWARRAREVPARRPLLATGLAGFFVLFVAAAAWSLASPLGSSPDEPAQLIRAAAVARGQLLGSPLPHATKAQGSTVVVDVPEVFASLTFDVACYRGLVDIPAGCQSPLVPSGQDQRVATYVGRYPPLYYALVGLPTLVFVSANGIYGARLMSAALSAAMLALAVVSVRRCRGAALMGAGVSLAITPLAIYLGGVINPSGLEVSSAIAAWAGAVALATLPAEEVTAGSVAALGLPLVVLVLVRALSPLWALAVLAAFFAVRPLTPVRVLLKRRCAQVWCAAGGAAAVAALLWDTLAGALRGQSGTPLPPGAGTGEVVALAFDHLHALVLSTIGQFGWLETPSPFAVTAFWIGALGAVVLISTCLAPRRHVLAVVGVPVAWALFTFCFVLAMAREYGIVGQGRDFMGLIVGLPVLAALAARQPWWARRPLARLSALIITGLAICQVVDFYGTLRRFTVGLEGPYNPSAPVPGGWQPPVPGAVLVAVFALAIAGLGFILLRSGQAGVERGPGAKAPVATASGSGPGGLSP